MSDPAIKTKPRQIRVLPEVVINQIAAGEVVDRPASVVRELVDNSIDAGATEIAIYLEEGGSSLIRVVDNGSGMARDDAILAFERHATSKISESEDLNNLQTLGFRGEALPSIASVSQLVLKTRNIENPVGTQVQIWGGKIKNVRSVASAAGTDIEVGRLFFNTPARRKFLRQPATEEQRVKLWVQHAALPFPGVRYRLFADRREILNLPPASLIDRSRGIIQGSSLEFSYEEGVIELFGLIGHPATASGSADSLVLIVNGRIVKDKLLSRAIREGYDSTLKPTEIPSAVVSLTIEPSEVDVNVHPQKSEVRFRHPQMVFQTVKQAVNSVVMRFSAPFVAAQTFPFRPKETDLFRYSQTLLPTKGCESGYQPVAQALGALGVKESDPTFDLGHGSAVSVQNDFKFSRLKFLAQTLGCYLLCEHAEKFYVVDMHAAHERYNFNLVRNRFRTREISSQQLLLPFSIELSPSLFANCVEHLEVFRRYGFEVEPFGESTIVVRSVPSCFKDGDLRHLILDVASVPLEGVADGRLQEKIDHIAARIACHASIRSGRSMEPQEVYALFDALDTTEFSAACPHGRPVVVSFSRSEVEQWFGRDR